MELLQKGRKRLRQELEEVELQRSAELLPPPLAIGAAIYLVALCTDLLGLGCPIFLIAWASLSEGELFCAAYNIRKLLRK